MLRLVTALPMTTLEHPTTARTPVMSFFSTPSCRGGGILLIGGQLRDNHPTARVRDVCAVVDWKSSGGEMAVFQRNPGRPKPGAQRARKLCELRHYQFNWITHEWDEVVRIPPPGDNQQSRWQPYNNRHVLKHATATE